MVVGVMAADGVEAGPAKQVVTPSTASAPPIKKPTFNFLLIFESSPTLFRIF
jgi:hypothetical protein